MGKSESKENSPANEEPAQVDVPEDPLPTVQPAAEFNAQADAEALNKAFQAFGTNESTITGIIANRSWEQRQEIKDVYYTKFNKTLISEIDSELSGQYRNTMDSLLQHPNTVRVNYITKILNDRLMTRLPDSRGKDIAILETIYPLDNTQLEGLKGAYQKANGNELSKDIEEKVTGPFKEWVVALVKNGRKEGTLTSGATTKDVSYLKNLPTEQWSPSTVQLQQLMMKSKFHLFSVFDKYETETGTTLMELIEKLDSGIREGFKVIVGSCLNGYDFFADGLYQSMKGFGTNDEKLIYIMVERCEVDLGNIKVAFELKYKQSLENFIKCDTSGDYKTLLLAILECKTTTPPATNEKTS